MSVSGSGRLIDKVILITGGARNQGLHHGRILAREGAKIMLCDVADQIGEPAALSLQNEGYDVRYHHLDVTNQSEWRSAINSMLRHWGRIDVLVNNAALAGASGLLDCTQSEWQAVIGVNQTGPLLGIQQVAPIMKSQGEGSIINVSSVMGNHGFDFNIAYAVSKGALQMLTKCAAMTLAPAVRVNSLVLGAIDSDMLRLLPADVLQRRLATYPMGRPGTFDEVSKALIFLASDESSFTTGSSLMVDGGVLAGAKQPVPPSANAG